MKKNLFRVLGVLLLLTLIFLVLPSPIDPIAYDPPTPPALEGKLAPNEQLKQAELLGLDKVQGPEEVAVDRLGRVYGGTMTGEIIRILPDGKTEVFAHTQGRPLGMKFDQQQRLIVCDAYKGLLAIDQAGTITVLTTEADGLPFKFTDALDIDSSGIIYFTDASHRFEQKEYLYDLLESQAHGHFLSYNPSTQETKVLLDGLYFANGVALSQAEDFVLINETYRYRIQRYWLKGPKAGSAEIFIENLPGFPDNISSNQKGTIWLALFTVRNPMMDNMHPSAFAKKQLAKLPKLFWPKPKPYGFVLALDEQGNITRSLQDPTGEHLKEITSAQEYDGYLYLGSLHNDRIGKLKL
ncbi:MAG: SMP-30/gluconolactonase/LRE family protein [Flammeovirgaceae bacterium]